MSPMPNTNVGGFWKRSILGLCCLANQLWKESKTRLAESKIVNSPPADSFCCHCGIPAALIPKFSVAEEIEAKEPLFLFRNHIQTGLHKQDFNVFVVAFLARLLFKGKYCALQPQWEASKNFFWLGQSVGFVEQQFDNWMISLRSCKKYTPRTN